MFWSLIQSNVANIWRLTFVFFDFYKGLSLVMRENTVIGAEIYSYPFDPKQLKSLVTNQGLGLSLNLSPAMTKKAGDGDEELVRSANLVITGQGGAMVGPGWLSGD